MRPRVAIVKGDFHDQHTTSWSREWLHACKDMGVDHALIDWREFGAVERLAEYDVVLWHFSHYSADEMIFARPILAALKAQNIAVFPDDGDSDHFDDKVAQAYLLRSLNIETPQNYMLHSQQAVRQWIKDVGTFPIVAKLRTGSGSHNVQLVRSAARLLGYSRKMFGGGARGRPSAALKISSNIRSARSAEELMRRARRIPEFVTSWTYARRLPPERGYVYLQDFVPGVSHDLKIVVVGDEMSYICRAVREGDFRASGGGGIFYDRGLVTPAVIEAAFRAAALLNSDCTGFDMVVDPRSGRALILEVSYGFSHTALLGAGELCDRSGTWRPTPLNAPRAVLKRLLERAAVR